MSRRTDPEKILDALADPDGMTKAEIEAELKAHGVDLGAALERFERSLGARHRLEEAKKERTAWRPPLVASEFLAWVKSLSTDEIIDRIRGLEGAVAHRDFGTWSRDALETHLYDLEVLKRRSEEPK